MNRDSFIEIISVRNDDFLTGFEIGGNLKKKRFFRNQSYILAEDGQKVWVDKNLTTDEVFIKQGRVYIEYNDEGIKKYFCVSNKKNANYTEFFESVGGKIISSKKVA